MKKIYLTISVFILALSLSAKVIYVAPTGTGVDGDSWTSAWQTIGAALDTAHSGDQIWIQQGTYTLNDASEVLYFESGVSVYGGFVGTETALDTRATDASLTVVERADTCTASFRLLTGVTADDEAIWDGFTFTNGTGLYGAGVLIKANNTLQNCIVENCVNTAEEEAYSSGGGVYMSCDEYVAAKMIDCIVRNNSLVINATNKMIGGAGVFVATGSSAALIQDCIIDANTIQGMLTGASSGFGAGVQIVAGTITGTTISNNVVDGEGAQHKLTCAGIHIVPEKDVVNVVKITNCTLTENDSKKNRGGAILIDPVWSGDNYKGEYTFEACVIDNNHSASVGAGCLITTSTAQVDGGFTTNFNNCIISNNTADGTGAAFFGNAGGITLNMTNCTMVNNYGGNKYGGQVKFNQSGCFYTLKNCLIWGNDFGWLNDRKYSAYSQMTIAANNTTSILYCAIEDADSINFQDAVLTENISLSPDNTGDDADLKYPMFEAPTTEAGYIVSGTETADWHLTAGSACIDWGNEYIYTDIEGNVRPLDGSGIGEAFYDIGAYEFDATTSAISPVVTPVGLNVYASNGVITLDLESASQVDVYAISGTLVKSVNATAGITAIPFTKQGLYIVRANNMTQKLIVE